MNTEAIRKKVNESVSLSKDCLDLYKAEARRGHPHTDQEAYSRGQLDAYAKVLDWMKETRPAD